MMDSTITLNNYLGLLNSLADDDKLRIIKVLSDSLHKKSDKLSLDNLFGAWKDDMSAEEIIESIHANRVLGTRTIESFE
jgi:hypothetical protein